MFRKQFLTLVWNYFCCNGFIWRQKQCLLKKASVFFPTTRQNAFKYLFLARLFTASQRLAAVTHRL